MPLSMGRSDRLLNDFGHSLKLFFSSELQCDDRHARDCDSFPLNCALEISVYRSSIITVSFRMTFDDFCRYFVSLAVCQPMNTSSLSFEKTWKELLINGEWAFPHRVGGCINNRKTFLDNPQVCER